MSTDDVPGAVDDTGKSKHGDTLTMGCWAEHEDGSLILVESTEQFRVVFSMFDMSHDPIIEYRDAMPEAGFKKAFSWDDRKKTTKIGDKTVPMIKWTWHDKTPFPFDRVIKRGVQDGPRYAGAEHIETAAERIAASLGSKAEEFDFKAHEHMIDRKLFDKLADKLYRAIGELRK